MRVLSNLSRAGSNRALHYYEMVVRVFGGRYFIPHKRTDEREILIETRFNDEVMGAVRRAHACIQGGMRYAIRLAASADARSAQSWHANPRMISIVHMRVVCTCARHRCCVLIPSSCL